jgi:hypothetical protein
MASTEVMRAGVRVAVAFLLVKYQLYWKKVKKERFVCVRNWIRKRNQLGASGMPTIMKELPQEIENSIKITLECQTALAVACTNH